MRTSIFIVLFAWCLSGCDKFLEEKDKMVKIPFSEREVHYACHKKIGIAVSTLGASRAVALGAYSFALSQLNIL